MTEQERLEFIRKIKAHELPSHPSAFLSAPIVDGPWEGYTIAEAMVLSQLQGPQK